MATYSRVCARLKTRFDTRASQKCYFQPSAEQYRSFRRAPAQPRPPAGTTRWVDITGGSKARGWRSGVQSTPPRAVWKACRVGPEVAGSAMISSHSPRLARMLTSPRTHGIDGCPYT